METEKTSSIHWPLLALMVLFLGGAVYALNHAFTSQGALNTQLMKQNRDLATRLQALETSLASRSDAPLKAELAQSKESLAAFEARLQTVEKTAAAPAPIIQVTPPPAGDTETLQAFIALKQAVTSGAPFMAQLVQMNSLPQVKAILDGLVPVAEKGVASESALRSQLSEFLATHPAVQTVEDPKLDGINSKLKGLLHITRKTEKPVDDYATLRAQAELASLDVLITGVSQLPPEAQAPLAAWLEAARTRQSALATLTAAETAIAKPQ
jgi:hypothetical protein